jgi:hypothetical protein
MKLKYENENLQISPLLSHSYLPSVSPVKVDINNPFSSTGSLSRQSKGV